MKKMKRLLAVALSMCMTFSVMPFVSYAATTQQVLPFKDEFKTNGYVPAESDGYSFNTVADTQELKVSDGVLKLSGIDDKTTRGKVYLNFDFKTVNSGTLVFETDYYVGSNHIWTDGFLRVYNSSGTEVLRLKSTSNGAGSTRINNDAKTTDTQLSNAKWTIGAKFGVKIEIDIAAKKWRAYQATTQTDGVWNYNQLQYKTTGVNEFPFMTGDADVDVSSLKFGLYDTGAGLDNFKVYKKVEATQSATSYNMLVGETQEAGITYIPSADKPSDIVWSSSDDSIASVDQNGVITAEAKGTATITVKSAFYENINYTYTVNVLDAAEGLTIDKAESTICVGDEVTLKVSPIPASTTYRDLVWSSSNTGVATVVDGVVTGEGKGSATITVAAVGKGGATITATATVNVIKPLTNLSISATETSLFVGETTTFTAVVAPSDASEVAKKWRSGNHYIATVDQNGRVTAVGEGNTEIYVSASGFTASQTITVTANNYDETVRKPALISFYTPTGYSFYDIADMEWAQAAVYSAVETGAINPDSETIFGAKRNIKRDEFVSVVIKALKLGGKQGSAENQESLKNFTDVPESNPYYAEIMKALELGIIQGVSETEFAPDADITRQDMAVVIKNAFAVASVKTEEGRLDFTDKDSIAEYAQTSVRILSKMGIMVGKGNNMFVPLENTTRAEVAVIVDRISALR